MDNEVLRLIKVITLLFLCGYKEGGSHHIKDEVKRILDKIKIDPKFTMGVGSDENIIENLRDSAEWMLYTIDTKHDVEDVIGRMRINCRDNPEYMAVIEKVLRVEVNPDKLDGRISSIINELRFITKKDNARKALQKANAKISFSGEFLEMQPFLNEVIAELSDLNTGMSQEEIPGVETIVDFGNIADIAKALDRGITMNDEKGMLNTGYQGLNDAIGGGLIRGWTYNIGAVSFGYKTGHLLDLTLNVPKFTKPWLFDPTKIPAIVRVSVETTTEQDVPVLYQRAHWRETGNYTPLGKIVKDEASEYIREYFDDTGYKVFLIKCNPNVFSVFNLISLLDKIIADGYEIHMCNFDYATKIAKHTPAPRDDIKLALTYDIMRAYCYPKGIALATGAQLDSQARAIAKENPSNCTKLFAEGSWYENSKSIYSELDMEILSNVCKHIDGSSYWCVSRGKRREGDFIPMNRRDFYYKFELGGIKPDVGEVSRALFRLPNSNSMSSANLFDD
jgi:galactitol-specific phosphotransferase system IIB component